jgi:hypothetical protein
LIGTELFFFDRCAQHIDAIQNRVRVDVFLLMFDGSAIRAHFPPEILGDFQ